MLTSTLIEFGLSDKEAHIYLALLELEIATPAELSQKTKINRSSVYVVLEALKERGFVALSDDMTTQKFIATSPEIFLKIAKDNAKKEQDIEKKIETILPELKALHKETKHRPKVYIYEGKQATEMGIYQIFEEQAKKGMNIYRVFADMADVNTPGFLPDNYTIKDDVAVIKKSGAKMHIITPSTKEAKEVVEEYKKHGSYDEFLLIPEEKFYKFKTGLHAFAIYEDKIEFSSLENQSLIIIESKEAADILKNIFDLAWEESKKLNTKD